jgi:putative alpha-1,2-mannosidase
MASLYVFLDAGFFPIAGQDLYYLHGVRVGKMSFHLSDGKIFTIIGHHASAENIYIQSVTLNGQPLLTPSIHHKDIVAGGTLEFTMGPQPSIWGQ